MANKPDAGYLRDSASGALVVTGYGNEIGYAEITTNATATSNYPTRTDVTGLSVTVTVGSRPIKVMVDTAGIQNSSTGGAVLSIMEGATELALVSFNEAANINIPVHREVRLAPTAGSHTYKIAISRLSAAGTVTLLGCFIQVVEC